MKRCCRDVIRSFFREHTRQRHPLFFDLSYYLWPHTFNNMSFLFGKQPKPEELVRKWKRELQKEQRQLDRQIRAIDMQEQKTVRSIKDLAKKGDKNSAKILAKEIVRSRAAKEKIYKWVRSNLFQQKMAPFFTQHTTTKSLQEIIWSKTTFHAIKFLITNVDQIESSDELCQYATHSEPQYDEDRRSHAEIDRSFILYERSDQITTTARHNDGYGKRDGEGEIIYDVILRHLSMIPQKW